MDVGLGFKPLKMIKGRKSAEKSCSGQMSQRRTPCCVKAHSDGFFSPDTGQRVGCVESDWKVTWLGVLNTLLHILCACTRRWPSWVWKCSVARFSPGRRQRLKLVSFWVAARRRKMKRQIRMHLPVYDDPSTGVGMSIYLRWPCDCDSLWQPSDFLVDAVC